LTAAEKANGTGMAFGTSYPLMEALVPELSATLGAHKMLEMILLYLNLFVKFIFLSLPPRDKSCPGRSRNAESGNEMNEYICLEANG
jgi:hypothetical protein